MDYKFTGFSLVDHKIGTIKVESWSHREIKTDTSEIIIYKADPDKPDSYGTKLFNGSLDELIKLLSYRPPVVNAPYLPKV